MPKRKKSTTTARKKFNKGTQRQKKEPRNLKVRQLKLLSLKNKKKKTEEKE
jgi:hypothetical protein